MFQVELSKEMYLRNIRRRSFVALCSSILLNTRTSLWAASRRIGVGTLNIALHRAAYQSSAVDDDHTAVENLDGTRHYIPHSANGTVSGLGPYDVKAAEWYFANRGKSLHSEQGIVAIPVQESMRAMMPIESLWPISDMWAVHDYQEPRSRLYTERIAQRYGQPTGIEDYCWKAQLLNLSPVFFLSLRLKGDEGVLSENFYWECVKGGSCLDLNRLPPVGLHAAAKVSINENVCKLIVSVHSPTQNVALAIRLKV